MKNLFPSLPDNPHLRDTFQSFPQGAAIVMQLADEILLRSSELTTGERELIAAYVSGLNACSFCAGTHKAAAEAFGIDADVIDALITNPDEAPVKESLKPILSYVACLTRTPAQLTEAHAQAVYDNGWSEQALYDAVQVCALFNFMNRIVEGTGVTFDQDAVTPMTEDEKSQRRAMTYLDFAKQIGVA